MLFRVLAVGDVTGESGVDFLHRRLRSLKKEKSIDFVVANGENAAGNGLLPTHAEDILAAGVDVITLGNHSFGKTQIADFLEESPYILRPANFTGRAPGRGWAVYDCGRVQVGVMNLIGRCNLDFNAENPFTTADRILKSGDKPTFTLVDFHAQATSEKLALSYYLDGRVSALWGTHTHVPTADGRVCPKGMGYLTDLGMTGPAESVLGVRPEHISLAGDASQAVRGTVDVAEMMGSAVHLHVDACGGVAGPISDGGRPLQAAGSPVYIG